MEKECVDINRIQEISMNDFEFECELIEEYISSSEKYIVEMKTFIDNKDIELFTRCAHSLKGASANMGAETVRELAFDLESKAKAEDFENSYSILEDLATKFKETSAYFTKYVNSK